jgi:hypothetical protein
MSPTVRTFVMGLVVGFGACLGFINYWGHYGGDWLIEMGQKMKVAAETRVEGAHSVKASQ